MNPLRFYNHCLIEKIKSERAAARGSKQDEGFKWGESPSGGEQTVCAALSYLKMEKRAKKRMEKGRKCRIKHLPCSIRGEFCSCLLALILFNEHIPAGSQFSAECCVEASGHGPSATSLWGQDRGSPGSWGAIGARRGGRAMCESSRQPLARGCGSKPGGSPQPPVCFHWSRGEQPDVKISTG